MDCGYSVREVRFSVHLHQETGRPLKATVIYFSVSLNGLGFCPP